MPTIIIDCNLLEPFEIGALLMATVAFPGATEDDARWRAAIAWCASIIQISPPETADHYPQYRDVSAKVVRKSLRTTNRRLRDRMVATRMALGFLQEGLFGIPAKLPAAMKRLSLNEAAKLDGNVGVYGADNIKKRAWAQSRPVIHLAAAMQVECGKLSAEGDDRVPYDVQDLDLHRKVVTLAQRHAKVVTHDPRLPTDPDTLINLVWIEAS